MCIKKTPSRQSNQRGLTLVELILFIVIVSVALAGVLTVLNIAARSSVDPMVTKQMMAIAEALLEEVQMKAFTYCDPNDANAATAADTTGCASIVEQMGIPGSEATQTRTSATNPFNNVNDYYVAATGYLLASPIGDITSTFTAPAGYSARIDIDGGTVGTPISFGPAANLISADGTPANLNVLRVAVTVCHALNCTVGAGSDSVTVETYRTRYSPNF